MTSSTGLKPETISARKLSQRIEASCAKQLYWVTGECKNAVEGRGNTWTFDLVSREGNLEAGERLSIIPCKIWGSDVTRIEKYLKSQGSTLSAALVDGMSLEVRGETDFWANSLRLRVSGIGSGFRRTGAMLGEQKQTLDEFAKSHPECKRAVVPNGQVHRKAKQGVPLPAVMLEAVTVVSPQHSQGKNDLWFELGDRGNKPEIVDYKSINWYQADACVRFSEILQAAKQNGHGMVALVRGGGHWSGMRAFHSRQLAEIIFTAGIPVVTAVGHADDVSLADRAALASFGTPSALAGAIDQTRKSQKSEFFKTRDQRMAASKQEEQVQAERQIKDLKAELAEATSNLIAMRQHMAASETQHVQTLLDMARRRVKGYSRLATGLVVGLAVSVLFGTSGWLEFFGLDPTPRTVLATQGIALIAAWVISWRLDIARGKLRRPAPRPMRVPPTTTEWMASIKRVRTIRRLRNLQRHVPAETASSEV